MNPGYPIDRRSGAGRATGNSLRRVFAKKRNRQKRTNGLEYDSTPRCHPTIRHIRAALEKDERNTLFQIKGDLIDTTWSFRRTPEPSPIKHLDPDVRRGDELFSAPKVLRARPIS